ncbi:thiol-disulfide oxidoreductase [Roseimaritima multifibrata]|uniref:Thiol-disulfide oxidoreductase n=1 Tax=Roseimaritima multifibrata TaxID=1930274 RepID=A0A517MB60_9BACT|nr:redoxin domain-containing protein [Roseimaritima multifibrata]QDS92027.1 thiol-disulfide oxidoreductase [Roseimaritima multifibrata]
MIITSFWQRPFPWICALFLIFVCGRGGVGFATDATTGQVHSPATVANLVGTDFSGKESKLRNGESKIATVIFFAKTDCPIANSYLPALQRMKDEFHPHGVRFLLVYPSPVVTTEVARTHAEEFAIQIPAFIDSDLAVAEALDAMVTPEVFVVDPTGTVLYRGRIDDKYVGFGKRRSAATREDLCEALRDVVAKRPVRVPATKPIGCIIARHVKH